LRECFIDPCPGRWAICRSGKNPIEIYDGASFWLEVDGRMKKTRMEFRESTLHGLPGEFYSSDGYWIRDGLRAGIGHD